MNTTLSRLIYLSHYCIFLFSPYLKEKKGDQCWMLISIVILWSSHELFDSKHFVSIRLAFCHRYQLSKYHFNPIQYQIIESSLFKLDIYVENINNTTNFMTIQHSKISKVCGKWVFRPRHSITKIRSLWCRMKLIFQTYG